MNAQLNLTEQEKLDLEAFLYALTDERFATAVTNSGASKPR